MRGDYPNEKIENEPETSPSPETRSERDVFGQGHFQHSESPEPVDPAGDAFSRQTRPLPDDSPIVARSGQYPVSLAFAAALVVIYGLTTQPSGFRHLAPDIAEAGVLFPPLVLNGEWWRLVTANLLHANPGHLFNNTFGIIIFGSLLEPQIGPLRLVGLYVLAALLGMGLSMVMLPNAPTLGASAIDYGLMAAYFTRILTYYYRADRKLFAGQLRSALFFVAIFVGWNLMELSTVNLWAHVGGFAAGVLWTIFDRPRPHRKF